MPFCYENLDINLTEKGGKRAGGRSLDRTEVGGLLNPQPRSPQSPLVHANYCHYISGLVSAVSRQGILMGYPDTLRDVDVISLPP